MLWMGGLLDGRLALIDYLPVITWPSVAGRRVGRLLRPRDRGQKVLHLHCPETFKFFDLAKCLSELDFKNVSSSEMRSDILFALVMQILVHLALIQRHISCRL